LNREELVKIAKRKGKTWAIAAMVDGSIGYHSPQSAKIRIEQLIEGERVSGCERTYACYGGDSLKEIEADFTYFLHIEKSNPEKVKRLVKLMKKLTKLSTIQQWTLSAAYPTLNL